MTEQKPGDQVYIVVEKPKRDGKRWTLEELGKHVVWRGSEKEFVRKERDVIMRRGVVYASLEDPSGNVVRRFPLNFYRSDAPRLPKQKSV